MSAPAIFTIGHSTRTFDEFVELLQAFRIGLLVDVRTVPRSRRVPHFSKEHLEKSLPAYGIRYAHRGDLGGLRKPSRDSVNTAWRNLSFRGYADYMLQPGFDQALTELIAIAEDVRTAVMCAEAVPWRCHRSLIADALQARGIEVRHIVGKEEARPHRPTSFAVFKGRHVTYPGSQNVPSARLPAAELLIGTVHES